MLIKAYDREQVLTNIFYSFFFATVSKIGEACSQYKTIERGKVKSKRVNRTTETRIAETGPLLVKATKLSLDEIRYIKL